MCVIRTSTQIEARRKEVSDVERELEREKKKSARFEKTCVLISKEWNEIQSAFETVLEKHDDNAARSDDATTKRKNNRRLDAFRSVLLRNVSEEDEKEFEKEFNPPVPKKKRKRGETADGDTTTKEEDTMEEEDEEESDDEEEMNSSEDAKFLADLKTRALKTTMTIST